jgi:NAD-dependent DNA ligase
LICSRLGIRHVGQERARLVAMHYETPERWLAAMDEAEARHGEAWGDLNSIDKMGDVVAEAILGFATRKQSRDVIEHLLQELAEVVPPEKPTSDSAVSGKTVVFTGIAGEIHPRRSQGPRAQPGRQGGRIGLEEDRLSGGWPRRRLKTGRSAETWRGGAE